MKTMNTHPPLRTGRSHILKCLLLGLALGTTLAAQGQVLINENFTAASGATPPTGWTTTMINAGNWVFNNPGGWSITGFSGNFAIFDSDDICSTNEEANMETASFDASQAGVYRLEFDNSYRTYAGGGQQGHVQVWNGTTWTEVLTLLPSATNDGYPTATHKTIDITTAAGSSATAKVRFRSTNGACDWFWAVDNVTVTRLNCSAPTASYTNVPNCGSNQYSIDVNITSMGSATSIAIKEGATTLATASGTGVYTVGPFASGSSHTFILEHNSSALCNVTSPVQSYGCAVSNDECANAIGLTVQPYIATGCPSGVAGTTMGATTSPSTTPPSTSWSTSRDDDVWYQFTATHTAHIIRFCNVTYPVGSAVDLGMGINAGCASGNTELAGPTIAITSGTGSYSASGLTIGTLYKIRVLTNLTTSRANFTISVLEPQPSVYVSSTTTQASSSSVAAGASNQQILGVQVVMNGPLNPLTLTSIDFNTTGSTNITDISNAKVYYTGTSSTFGTTTQFGNTVVNPNGTFTVTGSQVLSSGVANTTNYFWLVYDVPCSATNANVLDAQCTSLTVDGLARTPTQTDPSGTRAVTGVYVTTRTDGNGSGTVAAASTNVPFVYVNVTGSSLCPGTVTQVNATATASGGDVSQARCYHTTATTFSTATPFGSPAINPVTGNISFSGSQALAAGANYFWIVYDIPCAPAIGNTLNADISGVVVNGNTITPTGTATAANVITTPNNVNTVMDGDWSNPAIWTCGVVPTGGSTAATINHNVTVTTAGNTIGNVTIASGKSLSVSSGDLSCGPVGGGNRTFANNGTLTVSGGTLNVNGSFQVLSGSTFNQSGGDINVDGNAAGVTANSVASGTSIVAFGTSSSNVSGTLNLTGGKLTIVDPHATTSAASSTSNGHAFSYWGPGYRSGANHTLQLGSTASADAGGNTSGLQYNTWPGAGYFIAGNLIVDPGTGTNRVVTTSYAVGVEGNLTVNSNQFTPSAILKVNGNILVNAGGTLVSTIPVQMARWGADLTTNGSTAASSNAQTISGAGTFKNSATTSTANFTSLTINNNNTAGVTFTNANALLNGSNTGTVSGTLTMTAGIINVGNNTLVLGTSATATGTYTYTAGAIAGKFKRWTTGTTGARVFNLANAAGAKTATINFTVAPTAGSLTAEWVSGNPGSNGLPLTEGSNNFAYISGNGYWRIVAGDGLTGGTYTATFNGVGVADVSDYTTLTIGKRADASANWSLDGTYAAPTGNNANFTISRSGISTGFSEFGILSTAVPLPVTLTSFSGKNSGAVNHLSWTTKAEQNFSHFELQRSADGIRFDKVTTINANKVATGSDYAYTDEHPLQGINIYRLNIVDVDSRAALSDVVKLVVSSANGLSVNVYPNPVTQQLNVTVTGKPSGKAQLQLVNLKGQVLQTIPVSGNVIPVDMSSYATGTYMIRYTDDTHNNIIKISKN